MNNRLTEALADRYTIERELGEGGMATVYLAQDLKHDRQVAIKVLRPELAAVIGADRFLSEIKTTANLQHPHILPLFDSGAADGFLFYVMPYVQGETVRDRIEREKQLPVADAVRIASEVGAALDYAHRHNVIHRDIKPENILLHDGSALVADFGIALAASKAGGTRMTETGMSLGTPHYMSPEQAMGEREITARSDVYALGCVLYEMLLGEPPFTGPTAQSIVAKVMTEKPAALIPRRERIPPAVEDAVLTALEKLPADRFATAAEFVAALTAPGHTSALHAPGRAAAATGWRSRRVRLGFTVGGVVGLVAAAFFVGSHRGTDSSFGEVAFDQRTWGNEAVFAARFTHDGAAVVYSAASEGSNPRIFILRPEYPKPTPIGDPGLQLLSVSSSDELAVLVHPVYVGFRLFSGTLARMPLAGGAPRELLTDVREADWSPDGSQLAVIHEVDGKDRLEYPIGTVLFESVGYLSDVRISPKGDRVAFMEHPIKYDDRGVVGTVDLHGKHQVLTNEYWGMQGLAWSGRGERIVFGGSMDAGFYQLHSVDLSSHDRLILPSAGTLIMHDVASSGRWLIARDDDISRLFVKPPGVAAEQDYSWLDNTGGARLSGDGTLVVFDDASRDAGATYRTMLRKTDGSPAVALGAGFPKMISHDKRWVLSVVLTVPPQLMLYPVGPGETRRLDHGELVSYTDALFFPGGSTLLICGNEPGHAARCYVRPLSGGALHAITPEGTSPGATISPDGRTVLARTAAGYSLYPLDGGTPRAVPTLSPDDDVVRWSPDGRSLWVIRDGRVPLRVEQLDLVTGRRTTMMMLEPANRAGIVELNGLALADDPRVYAYTSVARVAQLFVVTGMQ